MMYLLILDIACTIIICICLGESDAEYTASDFESVPPILVGGNTMERAPSLESDLLLGRENETPSPDVTDVPVPAQVGVLSWCVTCSNLL